MKTPAFFFGQLPSLEKSRLAILVGSAFMVNRSKMYICTCMYTWLTYIWRLWMHFNWLDARSERRISLNLVSRKNISEMISEIFWKRANFWMNEGNQSARNVCSTSVNRFSQNGLHITDRIEIHTKLEQKLAHRSTVSRSIISCAKIDDGKEAKIILWFAFWKGWNTLYIRCCSLENT